MPLLWTPSHVIYDQTLPGNATNIDVTNLDYNNDGPWQLYMATYNPQGATAYCRLFFNGDYVLTNYRTQWQLVGGVTTSAGRYNYPNITTLAPGISSLVFGIIMTDAAGYARYRGSTCRRVATSINILEFGTCTDDTVANITSLRIASSIANGLGTGTRLILTRIAH